MLYGLPGTEHRSGSSSSSSSHNHHRHLANPMVYNASVLSLNHLTTVPSSGLSCGLASPRVSSAFESSSSSAAVATPTTVFMKMDRVRHPSFRLPSQGLVNHLQCSSLDDTDLLSSPQMLKGHVSSSPSRVLSCAPSEVSIPMSAASAVPSLSATTSGTYSQLTQTGYNPHQHQHHVMRTPVLTSGFPQSEAGSGSDTRSIFAPALISDEFIERTQTHLGLCKSPSGVRFTCNLGSKERRPCDICGDVSAGFHCNAYVCEACKKFFIRSSKSDNHAKYTCTKSSMCEINKDTRTHCQRCRYEKCIHLGMVLPGAATLPATDISEIPCRVCGAKSSGFHFGAITCEGCKGFFRRTINERESQRYTCRNGGSCAVTGATRNNCKSCRYRRCLAVGMSKDGSRIGRQPNAVKHRCAMEIEQLRSVAALATGCVKSSGKLYFSTPTTCSIAQSIHSPIASHIATSVVDDSVSICDTYLSGDSMVQSPQHQHRNLHQQTKTAYQYPTHSGYTPTELAHTDQASALNIRLSACPSAFSPHLFGISTGVRSEQAIDMDSRGHLSSTTSAHLVTMPCCGSASTGEKLSGSSLSMMSAFDAAMHQYNHLPTAYRSSTSQMSEEFQKPRNCQFTPRQYPTLSSGQTAGKMGKEQHSPRGSPGMKFFTTASGSVGNRLDKKVEFMEVDNSLQSAVQYGRDHRSFEAATQLDKNYERNEDQIIASQPIGLLHLSQAAQIYSQRERQRSDEMKQNIGCVGHSSLGDPQVSLYEREQFTCGVSSKAYSTPNIDLGSTVTNQLGDSESQMTYASNDGNANNRWQCSGTSIRGFVHPSPGWEISAQLEQYKQKVQNCFSRTNQQRGSEIVLNRTVSSTGQGPRLMSAVALPASPAMQASPLSKADTEEQYCPTNSQQCSENTSGCMQNMRVNNETRGGRFSGIGVEERQSSRTKVRRKSFTIDESECVHTVCGDRRSLVSGAVDNGSNDLQHSLCPCLIPVCQSATSPEANHQDGVLRQLASISSSVPGKQVYVQPVGLEARLPLSGTACSEGTVRTGHFSGQPGASYAPPHKAFLSRFNADSINKQHKETGIFEPDRKIVPQNVYCEVTRDSVHLKLVSPATITELEGLPWACSRSMTPSGDEDQSNKRVEINFRHATSGCDEKPEVDSLHRQSAGEFGGRPVDCWSTARTVDTGTSVATIVLPVQQQQVSGDGGETYAQYVTLADGLQQRFLNFCSSPSTSNDQFSVTAGSYNEDVLPCASSVPTLHTLFRGQEGIMDSLPHQIPTAARNGDAPYSDRAPNGCQTGLPPMVDLVKLRHLAGGQGYPSTSNQSNTSIPLEGDIQMSLIRGVATGDSEHSEHVYRLTEKSDSERELLPSWLGHSQRSSDNDRRTTGRCSTSMHTRCSTSSPTGKDIFTVGPKPSDYGRSSCSCDLGVYGESCLHCRQDVSSAGHLSVSGDEQSTEATHSLEPWLYDRTSMECVRKKCCSTRATSENENQASGTTFSTCLTGQLILKEDNLEQFTSEVVEAAQHLRQCCHRPLESIDNTERDTSEMLWCYMMKHFGIHVYRFSCAIPIVRDQPHPTLKTLVQESLYPIVLVQLSHTYNPSTEEYAFFNFTPSEKEVILQDFPELQTCEKHLSETGRLVKSLNLVETETALLCCLILLYSGERDSPRSSKLQVVYDFAVTALKHWIQDLSTGKSRLHDILSVIPRLHAMNQENQFTLEYLKREHHSLCFPNLHNQLFQVADFDALSSRSGV